MVPMVHIAGCGRPMQPEEKPDSQLENQCPHLCSSANRCGDAGPHGRARIIKKLPTISTVGTVSVKALKSSREAGRENGEQHRTPICNGGRRPASAINSWRPSVIYEDWPVALYFPSSLSAD